MRVNRCPCNFDGHIIKKPLEMSYRERCNRESTVFVIFVTSQVSFSGNVVSWNTVRQLTWVVIVIIVAWDKLLSPLHRLGITGKASSFLLSPSHSKATHIFTRLIAGRTNGRFHAIPDVDNEEEVLIIWDRCV
jgi:hypothetical protein